MLERVIERFPWMARRYLENFFYGYLIHRSSCFGKNVRLENRNSKLTIGEKAAIGTNSLFDLTSSVSIGKNVEIASGVTITTHDSSKKPSVSKPVVVKDGAYIGTGAIVLMGVTIGEKSIVGAGAVVTKNVGPGETVVGIPARQAKKN